MIRNIEFLSSIRVTALSEQRVVTAYGMRGGAPGAPGMNLLNGNQLPHLVTVEVSPVDILRIETPGGGAWAKPT